MPKNISTAALLVEHDLDAVVSVRGPHLTLRKNRKLWVIRAGSDPRAWYIRLNREGDRVSPWKHGRPSADSFLRPPEQFAAAHDRLRVRLRNLVARHTQPGHQPDADSMRDRRRVIRDATKIKGLTEWACQFPPEAIAFLERHQFQSRRWHLLNLWMRVPEGRELFDDVPALAWLAASSWCYRAQPVQRPLRSLRTLVRKPRNELLRWLGLPEGEGTIRLLRNVRPHDLDPMLAQGLCRVLRDNNRRRWLQNLPQPVHAGALHLLAYEMPLSFQILRAVSEEGVVGPPGCEMDLVEVLGDTLCMLRVTQNWTRRDALNRVVSPQRLRELHDRLAQELNWNHPMLGSNCNASRMKAPVPPPVDPASWMRPVATFTDLCQEGSAMHHCVAAYESRVAAGRYYVYAVNHPLGRATLGIQSNTRGHWSIAELRGMQNARVSGQVQKDVLAWLNSSQSGRYGTLGPVVASFCVAVDRSRQVTISGDITSASQSPA